MTQQDKINKPLILCILDGWGIGDGGEYDAIASAHTPNFDRIMDKYPNSRLRTDGEAVGLPDGQMGNSEVGHMNIGAGRVVMQYLPRITRSFQDGGVQNNEKIRSLAMDLNNNNKSCHIMGLLSDGGVHAHIDHIISLASIMAEYGVNVHIHGFTDGRDCSPDSGKSFILKAEEQIADNDLINLSTLSGRYYAMDRDNRWDRVKFAYDAIVKGEGNKVDSFVNMVNESYADSVMDEFIKPSVISDYRGIEDGDAIIFANFRNDRAREILQSLLIEDFDGFDRGGMCPDISKAIGMVEYSTELNSYMDILFPPMEYKNTFGEVISEHGLKQIRMAETEKYPHVTFFYNCGRENPYDGEDRVLVNSPDVATYDLQPEMSAPELSEKLISAINDNLHDVIIVNFANTDMVGHTGSVDAACKAVEYIDSVLGRLESTVIDSGAIIMITADHGNVDKMFDVDTNKPYTSHSMNPVPFIIVGAGDIKLEDGRLADIAPTMLGVLGIDKPDDMDGVNLIT